MKHQSFTQIPCAEVIRMCSDTIVLITRMRRKINAGRISRERRLNNWRLFLFAEFKWESDKEVEDRLMSKSCSSYPTIFGFIQMEAANKLWALAAAAIATNSAAVMSVTAEDFDMINLKDE